MPFSEYQDLALYHPHGGFFSAGGSPGRGGDFITSPEVGSLFGFVMAGALDRWWKAMRRPDPFVVVDAGAGTGTLMASILEAAPTCARALRYVMVERSAALRSEQLGRVPLTPIGEVFPLSGSAPGAGPLVTSTDKMPTEKFRGVIIANELLDNMAVDMFEFHNRHWNQVCIGLSKLGELEEVLVPIDDDEPIIKAVRHFGRGAADGDRVALHLQGQAWLRQALETLEQGRVVVIDYATNSRTMISKPSSEWLRTYRNHRPGGSPLDLPGSQDITCDVAVDQLTNIREPVSNQTQADFLDGHDLRTFIADAREIWHAKAEVGDLAAMRARARVQESRDLTDAEGLGAHRVLEWAVEPGRGPGSTPKESGLSG